MTRTRRNATQAVIFDLWGTLVPSEVPGLWAESPLAALVDAAVFSCTERIKKPDRRIDELACSRLGVGTSTCIYVGDGGSDELVGAAAVGMRAIQLRAADTEPHPWQGENVSSFSELLQLVAMVLRGQDDATLVGRRSRAFDRSDTRRGHAPTSPHR